MILAGCTVHLELREAGDCDLKVVGYNCDSVAILIVDNDLAPGEISDEAIVERMRGDGSDGRFRKGTLNKAFGVTVCFFSDGVCVKRKHNVSITCKHEHDVSNGEKRLCYVEHTS